VVPDPSEAQVAAIPEAAIRQPDLILDLKCIRSLLLELELELEKNSC
jgi:hypothetical protein